MKTKRSCTLLLIFTLALSLAPGVHPAQAAPAMQVAPAPDSEAGQASGLPEGLSAGWWAGAQAYIAQSEYEISWQEPAGQAGLAGAYQAPNRAQGLRTYFTPAGIVLVPRTEATPTWQLGLALAAYGTAEGPQLVPDAALSPAANRIEYGRDGLAEWHCNTESGLEQGFVLQPVESAGEPSPASYFVDLVLDGDLAPVLAEDGRAVEFSAPDGKVVLRYGDAQAVDAAGQPVPVELALRVEGSNGKAILRLALPALTQAVTLTARLTSLGAQTGELAGLPTGHDWTYKNPDGVHANDDLGYSVDTAGDVNGDGYDDIVVGAPDFDGNGDDSGKVFVWHGSANGLGASYRDPDWSQVGGYPGARLGYSVGTAGDVDGDRYDDLIAGGIGYHGASWEGAAFVWPGSPGGLADDYAWMARGGTVDQKFGWSVGTAGDVNGDGYDDVIVGAPYYDNNPTNEGGAFVWYGSQANGLCAGAPPCSVVLTDADWKYESNQAEGQLGWSVGTAGDVNGDGYADIVAGAPYFDYDGNDRGKVFVWYGSAGGLGASYRDPDWSLVGPHSGACFGYSIGTAGDVNGDGYADIVVGARFYTNGEQHEGAVFVFYGGGGGLPNPLAINRWWRFESNQMEADLGYSVGTAGDVNGDGYADIIAGAPYYNGAVEDEGTVLVWYGSAAGMGLWQRPPDWKREINQAYDLFGSSVASAGDVNGDGYSDILVGAPGTDEGGTYDVGQVYAYYGAPGGPLTFAGAGNPEPQVSALFGYSVSSAGDVNGDGYSDIVVGAPYFDGSGSDSGKVFVWYGSSASWALMATAPDWSKVGEYGGDWFGFAVGTAGDVNGDGYDDIIVGARYYHQHSAAEGAAYVWHGSAGGLESSYAWRAEGIAYATDFGYSVGTAGDVNGDGYDDVIVGTPYYDDGGLTDQGAAFAWYGSEANGLCAGEPPCSVPLTDADWKYESGQGAALFGVSVGTAGDVNGDGYADIVAGAPYFDYNGNDRGKVFVWYGSGSGLGPSQRDPDWDWVGAHGGAWFGHSVGTAGDVNGDGYSDLLVGERYYANPQGAEGAVYVFYGGSGGIPDPPDDDWWRFESNQIGTDLGFSVGTAGDVNGDGYADIVAGAPYYDTDSQQPDEGAVYIWYGSAAGMGDEQRSPDWKPESDQTSALLGWSVGTAGDVNGDGYSDILIGAPYYDYASANAGAVFVYHGSGQGLSGGDPDWIEGEQEGAQLGFSVGVAGDVNGDGYGDVIAGAPYFDGGQASEGRAFVYLGSSTGLVTATVWIAESNIANAHFGSAVGTAGDVNGDGYGDVIVGAPRYSNGQAEEGAAFVWHGSATGLGSSGDPTTANWRAEGDQALAYLGSAVVTAGDVNGDGYGDVIVGAYGYDHGQANEGRAYVHHGSATGLSSSPAWTAEGDQAEAALGRSVSSAGDVDGDGYSDVIVGSSKFTNGETNEGRALVYHGSAGGLAPSPAWTAESDQALAFFGFAVSSAGDVNGDGYSDVIVGAYQFQNGDTWRDVREGAAFVWHGSSAGLGADGTPANAAWMADGGQAGAQFGYAVSAAGDVNGDGYSDVIVGAPAYNNGLENEGRVFVYHGSGAGLSATARWTAEGDQAGAEFGKAVAPAGDITGDGFADVIVGAPFYDHVESGSTVTDVGLARVYHGNGQGALSQRPRQMQVGAAIPIAPLGVSDSETEVKLRLTGRTPLGRETVKVQWQVAPLGTPFTSTAVISGTSPAWTDTGVAGVEIVARVTGLQPGTPYHWRARLSYSGNAMGLGAGRWMSPAWNGWQELDFRTVGEPAPPPEHIIYLPIVLRSHTD